MSIADINKLRQKRAKLASDMQAFLADEKRQANGFSGEDDATWETMTKDIDATDKYITRMEDAEKYHNKVDAYIADTPEGREIPRSENKPEGKDGDEYRKAFDKYVRTGRVTDALETRAQSVGTDTEGGFTVAEEFGGILTKGLLDFGGIRREGATEFVTSTGAVMPFPTNDDATNKGEIVAENIEATDDDLVFGATNLEAYLYSSKVIKVSIQLMQDSAFNLDQYLGGALGERLGRISAQYHATGTGTGQPRGLATAATSAGSLAVSGAVTHDEMLEVKHAVNSAYRRMPNAKYVFSDATLLVLKKLKDNTGLPLWEPRVSAGEAAFFDGSPYVIDDEMPALDAATGARAIVYGDLSKYYIRRVLGFQLARQTELYIRFHQVGFMAFMREDSDLIDAGGRSVAALLTP